MTLAKKQRDYINEFREAFAAGLNAIVNASKIYVDAIDDNPILADEFRDEFSDSIPASAWAGFEAVGRKWMHPKLLMGGGGRFATKIKRLPYSTQLRIFDGEPVEFLTTDGDTLMVDVRNLTKEQADQLFSKYHLRTLAEQKAYLESLKPMKVEDEAETLPYVIVGGKITFKRNTVLTRQEIKRLLQEM